ncbi:Na+/proline symporter [Modicisalibacter ilicicola DSM 19980]|uniref:Na+/proline symporter n=1 Tax=Modicisalibacter ilicicola DSM 19980 TaxID=1121942 RepID=A0A1M4TLB8_9GAMM|nr:sodium:solute symporter [Halomonas ilicicola]SHE45302.1 Na+/proline symporter [Halomonas ilicicola DSM 19980]
MLYITLAALGAALLLFAVLGLRASRADTPLDDYVTARNSQGASALGLSFLASGMGAWILFTPPEIGAFVGPIALGGYAIGSALPFIVLGLCGPAIRRRLPEGRSIGEFAAARFGGGARRYVSLISVLYMACFLTAELTAIGGITALLSDVPGSVAVLGVALTTLVYTAWGGLRASLVTDRWQALLLVALLAVVGGVAWDRLPAFSSEVSVPGIPVADALSVALTLVIAVTAANLFHQGYWQRVWAAKSGAALGRGALLGGMTTVIVVAVVGGLGILAAMSGLSLGEPPMPFFALLEGAPAWLTLLALVLAVTLVASSVDTLQNGIASLVVGEGDSLSRSGVSLGAARWITLALMVPVVAIALQGVSVLRLFLIADLLCATAVVPVLLGLWSRMSTVAAVSGGLAGVVGAILPGWIAQGNVIAGIMAASFPGGVPTLWPFLGALLASTLVSLLVALARPRWIVQYR